MYQDNLFCLDLAKTTIQGCLLDKSHQTQFNRTFSRKKLTEWLSRQQPMTVAMEACSTAHYWSRMIERLGHRPLLVPTRTANRYREGHKTNATDALAVGVAARASRPPGSLRRRLSNSRKCSRWNVSANTSAMILPLPVT